MVVGGHKQLAGGKVVGGLSEQKVVKVGAQITEDQGRGSGTGVQVISDSNISARLSCL